jgi:hypothetical protein
MSRRLLVVVLLLAVPLPVLGQSPPNQPTFGTGTTAVVVDVVVRDRKGNPVTDLRKEDFELLEDGVQQEIGDITLVASELPGRAAPPRTSDQFSDSPPAETSGVPRGGETVTALVFERLMPESRQPARRAVPTDIVHFRARVVVTRTDAPHRT